MIIEVNLHNKIINELCVVCSHKLFSIVGKKNIRFQSPETIVQMSAHSF